MNGTLEEVFWRGTYVRTFPDNPTLGFLYPGVGFGIWHLAPLVAMSISLGTALLYLLGGALFGLCWGYVAWRTGSIRWAVISHVLSNLALVGTLALVG